MASAKGNCSVIAVTRNHLTTADWTALNIATQNVKLPLENAAIMARLSVCAPITGLLAVSQTLALTSCDGDLSAATALP